MTATLIARLGEIENLEDTETNNIAVKNVLSDFIEGQERLAEPAALNVATGLELAPEDLATLIAAIKTAFTASFKAAFVEALTCESLVDEVIPWVWSHPDKRQLLKQFINGTDVPINYINMVLEYRCP
jgi:hypothetical protein